MPAPLQLVSLATEPPMVQRTRASMSVPSTHSRVRVQLTPSPQSSSTVHSPPSPASGKQPVSPMSPRASQRIDITLDRRRTRCLFRCLSWTVQPLNELCPGRGCNSTISVKSVLGTYAALLERHEG